MRSWDCATILPIRPPARLAGKLPTVLYCPAEGCPSGLRCRSRKAVSPKRAPWVRIPPLPPYVSLVCFSSGGVPYRPILRDWKSRVPKAPWVRIPPPPPPASSAAAIYHMMQPRFRFPPLPLRRIVRREDAVLRVNWIANVARNSPQHTGAWRRTVVYARLRQRAERLPATRTSGKPIE